MGFFFEEHLRLHNAQPHRKGVSFLFGENKKITESGIISMPGATQNLKTRKSPGEFFALCKDSPLDRVLGYQDAVFILFRGRVEKAASLCSYWDGAPREAGRSC